MKLFINGFGRIWRSVLRAWLSAPDLWPGVQVVGINDIAGAEMCACLFQYDSVFGPWRGSWRGSVALDAGCLVVGGRALPLHRVEDISGLNLRAVDVVLECTGRAETRAVALRGVQAGARRILVSGPM